MASSEKGGFFFAHRREQNPTALLRGRCLHCCKPTTAALSASCTTLFLNSVVCAIKGEQITLSQSQPVLHPSCLLIQNFSCSLLSSTSFSLHMGHPQADQGEEKHTGAGEATKQSQIKAQSQCKGLPFRQQHCTLQTKTGLF